MAGGWLISLALRDVLGWAGSPLGCLFVHWLWKEQAQTWLVGDQRISPAGPSLGSCYSSPVPHSQEAGMNLGLLTF